MTLSMPLRRLALLFMLVFVSQVDGESNSTGSETGTALALIYQDTLAMYNVFPAIDPDPDIWESETIRPIEVVISNIVTSIDSIEPGLSQFTAKLRTALYWKKNDCNQTETHRHACETSDSTGSNFRFLTQENISSDPKVSLKLTVNDIHSTVFQETNQEDIQPNGELVESQMTIKQQFDMRYFPYEVHALEISFTSLYSTNVVNLTPFPAFTGASITPSVPAGWEFIGLECDTVIKNSNRAVLSLLDDSSSLEFHTFQCLIYVKRDNPGWWVTSFFLYVGVILIAFLGSVGVMSHGISEARDDRDAARRELVAGTRLIGTFTLGLMLTYVFQVEPSPYGQQVEFWPRIPTSTMVYVLGLATILVQSGAGLICCFLFKKPLLSEGFVGGFLGPYDFDKLPTEGEVGEDRSPLIRKKYDPRANQSYEEAAKDILEDEPEAAARPTPISRVRKNNTKSYNVLSVGEAHQIQKFVKEVFLFKVMLLCTSYIIAMSLLVSAKRSRNDVVDSVQNALSRS